MIRRLCRVVGFASASTGLLVLLTPVSVPVSVPLLPALGVTALVALVVGVLVVLDRSTGGARTYDLPDPGRGVCVPGDGFDERLRSITARPGASEREAVRERLRTVAVATLMETTGCDRATARERLDEGAWTDDRAARAFFTDATPSRRERLRTLLAGEATFARRARRVVAVLAERAEGSP